MRPARMSPILEDSMRRLERMKAISPPPNFGTGVSIADQNADEIYNGL